MTTDELDCQECGACCIEQLIVLMPGDDVPFHMITNKSGIMVENEDRFPETMSPPDLCFGLVMRRQLGRCIALDGKIGSDVACKIYDNRPKICRVMRKGDWACVEVRTRSYMR